MANKSLFASMLSRLPKANAVNEAGGLAYKLEPKHALAQVAATGTFGNAFYSTAETQLDEVLKLIDEVDDNQYLAKLALYAREKAFMKDMPAALLVALSVRDTELMHRVFDRVVDNGRVLRTVFQMIRSGQFKNKAGTIFVRQPDELVGVKGVRCPLHAVKVKLNAFLLANCNNVGIKFHRAFPTSEFPDPIFPSANAFFRHRWI